jgi:hypothetical protein
VRNKTDRDSKGENRREGNQTLGAERSGQATPAKGGSSNPHVLKGVEAHERGLSRFAMTARFGWRRL